MQSIDKNKVEKDFIVGVYYQNKSKSLENLFKDYKNNFIFSNSLDQFSLFLCDKILVEDKNYIDLWNNFIDVDSIDNFLHTSEKKQNYYGDDYFFVKENLIQFFSSPPVDLYFSLRSSGRSHFRKFKSKGLYLPQEMYKDSLIRVADLGLFFRAFSKKLLSFVQKGDLLNFLIMSGRILEFNRMNLLINKKPLSLFGINLCINKSLQILISREDITPKEFLTLSKEYLLSSNHADVELLLLCYFCHYAGLNTSSSFSSLFLNSLFKEPSHSFIDTNFQLENISSLSSKEKELILNHPYMISSILKALKLGDELFHNSIKYHHGSVTGKGFSDSFRSNISHEYIDFIGAHKIIQTYLELRPNEPIDLSLVKVKENISSSILKSSIDKLISKNKNLFSNS